MPSIIALLLVELVAGASTSSRTPSQTPTRAQFSCNLYSGSSTTRDPCCRLLTALYPFGPSANDTVASATCDGKE